MFGMFTTYKNKKRKNSSNVPIVPIDISKSIRLPRQRDREIFGYVISELGGARMHVLCEDGKERNCRIPGRLKRSIWVKENDIVIVQPWEIQGDTNGDIVWRYKNLEIDWLKKKGMLNFMSE